MPNLYTLYDHDRALLVAQASNANNNLYNILIISFLMQIDRLEGSLERDGTVNASSIMVIILIINSFI